MSVEIGSRLGPYEIVAPLGVGGMGEVYRARDSKLNRDVAIKVLLPDVAGDANRLARFKREAQVLASLNHPNIANVHGFEDGDGVHALVMELVEGPTLADRIAQRPLALEEALPLATQIAEAVEAAHQQGIVHRDLKPANIKVRSDGVVKVLDFGLAKALDVSAGPNPNATTSPTLSMHATQAGVILGTAAYMPPEQARGRAVDARADIWAFGCVLFEMLTGTRAFQADDVTDTMVAVLSKEPDWSRLPSSAAGLRPLLTRCLKKDPRRRLQAIGEARIALEELIDGGAEPAIAIESAPRPRFPWTTVAAAALLTALVTGIGSWALMRRDATAARLPQRFEIASSPGQLLAANGADRNLAISRDGRSIVYRSGATGQLVVRDVDSLDVRRLEGVTNARQPFFSPDGRWVGYFEGTVLKKVPTTGGSPVTIIDNTRIPRGAAWSDDNTIVFATSDSLSGLQRVSANGGPAALVVKPDTALDSFWFPSFLPNGRGILFTITAQNQGERAQIAVLDFQTGQFKPLTRGSEPQYVANEFLMFVIGTTLHAARFDLTRLELTSDPVPIVNDVFTTPAGSGNYGVSESGTLVFIPVAPRQSRTLVWVDRRGVETPIAAPPRAYAEPRLSPDGRQIAIAIRDQDMDIWIWDIARELLRRLTFTPGSDQRPIWSPDGRRILFSSQRSGVFNIYAQSADGSGPVERVTESPDTQAPFFVTPDGSGVVGLDISPITAADIVWFRSPAMQRLVQSPSIEQNAELSPDGRYIAFESNASGNYEVFVRPFPKTEDGLWQISTGGASRPKWALNGRELYYLDALSRRLTAVPIQMADQRFTAGKPQAILENVYATPVNDSGTYDVSRDGQRFVMIKSNADDVPDRIVVVLDWLEELKAKVR